MLWLRLGFMACSKGRCSLFEVGGVVGVNRVPNSPTGQVLEAGPGSPVLVDVHDWT